MTGRRHARGGSGDSNFNSGDPATASIPPVALARPWYVPRCAPLERGQVAQSAIDVIAVVFIPFFVSLLATSVGAAVYLIFSAPFR